MEFIFLNIIYIITGICLFALFHSKILILIFLLKIFDIVGPPQFLKNHIRKKMIKYAKKHTNINNIKTTKNAIYLLMPHGATFFPAIRLSLLLKMDYPIYIINKWFLLIPGFVGIIKFFGSFITNEKGNIKSAIFQEDKPIIIYPNGAREVLFNSSRGKTKFLRLKDKLLKYLLNSKKEIYVIRIKNESECYYFSPHIIKFYKFINNFIDIGIPFPLPYFSNKKLHMRISKKIITSKIKDIEVLRREILYRTII